MGAGGEGEVRPCAWKWKLKLRIENEERGLRPRSSSQQRERERERERKERPGRASGACPEVNLAYVSSLSGISPSISPCGAVWCVVKCAGYQAREGFQFRRGLPRSNK